VEGTSNSGSSVSSDDNKTETGPDAGDKRKATNDEPAQLISGK
jgi:hypothetical protein